MEALSSQTSRLTRGYGFALVVLATAVLLSYIVLQHSIVQQDRLNKLHATISATQITLRDTYDRSADLKQELQSNRPQSRLLKQIRTRLQQDLDKLASLQSDASALIGKLAQGEQSNRLPTLYHESPYNLSARFDSYLARTRSLLVDIPDVAADSTVFWVPTDAAASNHGFLADGFGQAFVETRRQLEMHHQRVQRVHTAVSIGFVVVLLLLTGLIFLPLTRGLQQVHRRVVAAQEELTYIAYNDTTTGLPNAVGAAALAADYSALMVVRLDNLSAISNAVGHTRYRQFYCRFAERLVELFDTGAQVARSGDEEFSVLLQVAPDQLTSTQQQGWLARLGEGLVIDEVPVYPEVVLGWDLLNSDTPFDETLANARLAVLDRNPDNPLPVRFRDALRAEVVAENTVAEEIRAGLKKTQFVPYYQIKVDAVSARPVGMEALCRWQTELGLVSPAAFIPVAERKGLIVEMTWQLLDKVIADYRQWRRMGLDCGTIAVNIAEAVLCDRDFPARLAQTIAGLPMHDRPLEFEITENVALSNARQAVKQALDETRRCGIPIALDDFGTGYASLSSVAGMELDIIKIDQSFVTDMNSNLKNRSVVESVLSICHTMRKTSVAEGVETAEQAQLLAGLGCDILQGYYFYRPSAAADVTEILQSLGDQRATA